MERLIVKSLDEVYRELKKGCGSDAEEKMHTVMHKFKHGTLHSGKKKGKKKGPVVSDRDQAIAIGLSESGQSK